MSEEREEEEEEEEKGWWVLTKRKTIELTDGLGQAACNHIHSLRPGLTHTHPQQYH